MPRKRVNSTKYEIIQVATSFFLDKGVSVTYPRLIADELGISTGNITYYFPTKEHLLAVLVKMLCDYQWKFIEQKADDGLSSVMSVCLELAAMAAMCEENEVARDFYISSYTSDLCLELIQKNDVRRARQVFGRYRPDWTDEKFAETEVIVSGVEYATLKTNEFSPPLEKRISSALEAILSVYGVPEDIRRAKITQVLAMDYRAISRDVFTMFKEYVENTTEQALEEIMPKIRRRNQEVLTDGHR